MFTFSISWNIVSEELERRLKIRCMCGYTHLFINSTIVYWVPTMFQAQFQTLGTAINVVDQVYCVLIKLILQQVTQHLRCEEMQVERGSGKSGQWVGRWPANSHLWASWRPLITLMWELAVTTVSCAHWEPCFLMVEPCGYLQELSRSWAQEP